MHIPLVGQGGISISATLKRWRKPSWKRGCVHRVGTLSYPLGMDCLVTPLLVSDVTQESTPLMNLHTVFVQRCSCVCVFLRPILGLATAAVVLNSFVFPDLTRRKIFIRNLLKNRWMKLPFTLDIFGSALPFGSGFVVRATAVKVKERLKSGSLWNITLFGFSIFMKPSE